nr:MAG TPA: hypothetical protein [Crassvirales sp.]
MRVRSISTTIQFQFNHGTDNQPPRYQRKQQPSFSIFQRKDVLSFR